MTPEQKKKGDDGELSSILIVCGIFALTLLIVDTTYGGMQSLIQSWIRWPFIILHIAIAVWWVFVIKTIDEPNKEVHRKWLLAATIAALLLVLGHRVGFIDEKMFNEEVEKNKQEQNVN